MRPDWLEILCCPEDQAALRLAVTDRADDDVLAGTLTCERCGFVYPIEAGIPNLLPQAFHRDEVHDAEE